MSEVYDKTPLMTDESDAENAQSSGSGIRKRRHRRRRSLAKPVNDSDNDDEVVPHSEQKKQNLIFLVHSVTWLSHMCVTIGIVGYLPVARPLMFFHGILSPATLILYCVGALSFIYGYLSMYRVGKNITDDRRAQWFRRYMRTNKLLALVWVFATLSMIFGCWEFKYVQTLENKYPIKELKEQVYEPIVKQVILALSEQLYRLEQLHQITPASPPLNLVGFVGEYFYIAIIVITIIPVALMLYTQRFQRRYYTLRFIK